MSFTGTIRVAVAADAPAIQAIYAPMVEHTAISFEQEVPTVEEIAQRNGVGRALYERLLPLLERQGYHAAYAGIALPNAGSVGLHEALGFTHIGTYPEVGFKQGKWQDVGYWRRELDRTTPPRSIIPFSNL